MKTLPSLRKLQYFIALSDQLHFGKASEQCAVTQSTLSAGIRDLEIQLGVQLAERTKRQVRLTATGQQMLDRAQNIIQLACDMSDAAKASKPPLSGPLRLGLIPTIAPFLLPKTLPTLRKQHPELELQLVEEESAVLLAHLQASDIDCIVLALPFPTPGLQTSILFMDRFFLTVPKTHILAQSDNVSLHDFQDEPMLLLNQGHCLRDHALTACSLAGHQQAKGFDGTSLQTIVQMVAGGMGVTILPEIAVQAGLASQAGLVSIPILGETTARQIALAWRNTSPRQSEFNLLAQFFAKSK